MRSRDGKCEDRLNNIHCNYDYGDCCLPVVDHVFCEDCICAEDGLVHRSRDCKLKSDNLQYNTLVCWANGTSDLLTKHLKFQVIFSKFLIDLGHSKLFLFIFVIFKKKNFKKIERVFAKNFARKRN